MKNAFLLFVLSALFMLAVVGCIGCSTEKKILKAKNVLEQLGALDSLCAEEFEVPDSIAKGDTIITTDTLWGVRSDTVVKNDTVRITNYKEKVVTNTRTIRDTIYRENTARVSFLLAKVNERDELLNRATHALQATQDEVQRLKDLMKGKIRIPWWWLVALAAFAFRGTLLKLFKSII